MGSGRARALILPPSTARPGATLLLRLCRRGHKPAQTQVHGGLGVVIGPGAGEDEYRLRTRPLVAAEQVHLVSELAVIHFAESGAAEIETGLQSGDQLVLAVG